MPALDAEIVFHAGSEEPGVAPAAHPGLTRDSFFNLFPVPVNEQWNARCDTLCTDTVGKAGSAACCPLREGAEA